MGSSYAGRRILFVLIFGLMGLFQQALDDTDMIVHIVLSASGGLFFLAIKTDVPQPEF